MEKVHALSYRVNIIFTNAFSLRCVADVNINKVILFIILGVITGFVFKLFSVRQGLHSHCCSLRLSDLLQR